MAAFGSGGFGNQSGFGQSSSAFGGNAFGSNSGPFGGQSAFGSQSNSLFGSQPQSLSSFSQSAPFGASSFGAQSAPAFGSGFGGQSTSAFGSGFGAQSSSAFGAPSAFGSGSSLFGANRPPTSGFGSSNPFGQSQSTWGQSSSAFGGSSAFGSTGGGLFGNSGTSNSVFGQGPGAFGGSAQAQTGTAGVSWQVTTEYDAGQGQAPSKYQSITMMNQFRTKSIEELRVEDYTAGNKGGNQGSMGGGFGSAQSGGLFGSSGNPQTGGFGSGNAFGSTSGFGQSSGAGVFGGGGFGTSSGFGQQSSSGFGGGSGGAFGAQSGGGLFAQSSSAFGAQSIGGFGNSGNTLFGSSSGFGSNPPSGGLFGSGGGGFGNAQQSQPAFGASNTQSGLFSGAFQSTGNSGFGSNVQQTTPSLFGSNTGQQSLVAGSSSGFNNAGPQKPLFGSTGGNSFGGATFGSTAPGNTGAASFGAFNAGPNAGNAFGFGNQAFGQQPAQQVQVPNGFGSSVVPGQAYGIMGNANNPSLQGTFAAVTQQNGATVAPPGANYGTVLYNLQKLQSELVERNKLLEKQAEPSVPASRPSDAVSVVVLPPPSPFGYPGSARRPSISGYKWAGGASQRTKMRGVAGRIGGPAARISGAPLPSSSDGDKERMLATPARSSTDVVRRMSFFSPHNFSELRKPSTVRPSELPTPIPATPKMLPLPGEVFGRRSSGASEQDRQTPVVADDEQPSRPGKQYRENPVSSLYDADNQKMSAEEENRAEARRINRNKREGQGNDFAIEIGANGERTEESTTTNTTRRRSRSSSEDGSNDVNFVWARQRPSSWSLNRPVDSDDQYNPHKYLPSQTRSGFYTVPTLAELASQTMAELQQVKNFTVGREGYGEITWVDPVDVRGLNLDAVVDIQHGEVAVYPEKEAEQLDAPARVKLEGMFAKRKKLGESVSDAELNERYKQKLRNYCSRNDLHFIDYNPTKGEWLFEVRTFAD